MIYFDKIHDSEGTDRTSVSKECGIFHYWYFLNVSFKL